MNQRDPGLAPSRNSGGSRAANADGAPCKHRLSIAAGGQIAKPEAFKVGSSGTRPGWITHHDLSFSNTARAHPARTDRRPVADSDTGHDDGAAADPDIAPDSDRAAEF